MDDLDSFMEEELDKIIHQKNKAKTQNKSKKPDLKKAIKPEEPKNSTNGFKVVKTDNKSDKNTKNIDQNSKGNFFSNFF